MDNEGSLRDLGLTKYEASAYSTLLKEGVTGAQELSRKSDIPVGKIYEVLSNLNNMGLVEFQRSRPRKYRAVKPSIALNNLYTKKEEETKNELENFKLKVSELESKFCDMTQPEHTELQFWATSIGEEDIIKNIKNMLDEVETEILHVKPAKMSKLICKDKTIEPSTFMPTVVDEFVKAAKKGIKIKIIFPEEMFTYLLKNRFEHIKDPLDKEMIKKNIDAKALDCDYDFRLIDEYITHIPIPDPLIPDKIFGELKVYDKEYAAKLKDKFEELWVKGKKVSFNF
ncbi:helix-turn-helix domain-containing protein [Methanolobus sediminis]|uniref:Helix-turn-helix domain-containing protein n=1 Tax=Methanolobus sediminis TaxID=3072978 RepID=A0AA51UK58_9EURY|nr:helix-turn-helix domain-containing protein [Methanolobus sediminis]WMW24588.1 helix-turn-helix domain-containing protein [Methanolobus sediminis]